MQRRDLILTTLAVPAASGSVFADPLVTENMKSEIIAVEIAFAKTLPELNFDAFMSFWAEDAVYTNRGVAVVGKDAIAKAYSPFFKGPAAPFSWSHEEIHVHVRLSLAQSHGRIQIPNGTVIGRYTTTWQRTKPGNWKIIFDDVFSFSQIAK